MKLLSFPDSLKLIAAIAVSELAGIIGSMFTFPAVAGWYPSLVKPALTPPAWVFGPVWTVLFALMGIAAFLVWSSYATASADKKKIIKIALALFGIQLALNTLWSIIFFGWQNPYAALVEIIFLWLAIVAVIVAFAKISRPAAWLLAPYLVWVSFAGYLNYNIWQLNPPTVSQAPLQTVRLYYYNPQKDTDASGNIQCSRAGLVPVERQIPRTQTPIQDTVNLLLAGEIKPEEKALGIETEYPLPGLSLAGADLSDGTLTLSFDDPGARTSGGSCRVGILWFQIDATAKQFPAVNEVRFIPEELFQP